ncbi:14898_t:CDS:1 [Funneliformis geosporum]|nr:14898_t:CDS:1 [Funneliformis geosporum]
MFLEDLCGNRNQFKQFAIINQIYCLWSKLLSEEKNFPIIISSELIDVSYYEKQELTTDMAIAHLFLKVSIKGKYTMQVKKQEVSCRHSYGKKLERGVQEIITRDNIQTRQQENNYLGYNKALFQHWKFYVKNPKSY